jgi:nucleoside-diphosphate-sugar epimerase
MASGYLSPLNIGSSRAISMNALMQMALEIAGVEAEIEHIHGPQGVRGRSSDNALILDVLGWQPTTPLEAGMKTTYAWIEQQVAKHVPC